MFSIVILASLVCLWLLTIGSQKTVVRKCYSVSCKRNRMGKCMVKQIDVYDNGAIGICLWHTASMKDRILDPLEKGREIGKKDGEIALLDKLLEDSIDRKAIKSPEEFAKWMKKHLNPEKK